MVPLAVAERCGSSPRLFLSAGNAEVDKGKKKPQIRIGKLMKINESTNGQTRHQSGNQYHSTAKSIRKFNERKTFPIDSGDRRLSG